MPMEGFQAGPASANNAGVIYPARFVIGFLSSTLYNNVQQAVDGTVMPVGISAEWDRLAPGTAFDAVGTGLNNTSGPIASPGQDLTVYQDTETCMLECGSNTGFNSMSFLMPDANSRGILATSNNYYGAQALWPATASGQRIKVKVVRGKF